MSGGDALIQVSVPPGVAIDKVVVSRNGADVTHAFVAADSQTLRGLVGELVVGANFVVATTESGDLLSEGARAELADPWADLRRSTPAALDLRDGGVGLGAAARRRAVRCAVRVRVVLPHDGGNVSAVTEHCTARFRPTSRKPPLIDGHTVDYIVRVESGVINESIYRIAIIDDPAQPDLESLVGRRQETRARVERQAVLPFRRRLPARLPLRSQFATDALNIADTSRSETSR